MNRKIFSLCLLLVFVTPLTQAEPKQSTDALIKELYSKNFEVRSKAAAELSATESSIQITQIIKKLQSELNCEKKVSVNTPCHDSKFAYNAILVAGNLAAKNQEAPWDFLVNLWKGKSVGESQEDDFLSNFSKTATPNRLELQNLLSKTIKSANICPACNSTEASSSDWPLSKISKYSKKKNVGKYQIYSYERNYSPELQKQFQIRSSMSWIFAGDRRISCNAASDIIFDSESKTLIGIAIENSSGESLQLDVSLYSLPESKRLCAFSIQNEGADPLGAQSMSADAVIKNFFEIKSNKCLPKKTLNYRLVKIH